MTREPVAYDQYMPDAVGFIKAVEARVLRMRKRLALIRGKWEGCSCCTPEHYASQETAMV